MVRKTIKLALKLLMINLLSVVIALLVMVPLTAIWKDFLPYQWLVTLSFTFLMWLFVWLDTSDVGQKDVQKDKILKRKRAEEGLPNSGEQVNYQPWTGFIAGFFAQLPVFLLAVGLLVVAAMGQPPLWLTVVLRSWNMVYMQLLVTLDAAPWALPWLYLLLPFLFAFIAGLGYQNGPKRQARMETIIERNKTKKAKRVQDDKKKAMMRKKPTRR